MTATAPITGLHAKAIMRIVLENPGSMFHQIRQEMGPTVKDKEIFDVFLTLERMKFIQPMRGPGDSVRYYATAAGVRLLDSPKPQPVAAPVAPKVDRIEWTAWLIIGLVCGAPVAWGIWRLFK